MAVAIRSSVPRTDQSARPITTDELRHAFGRAPRPIRPVRRREIGVVLRERDQVFGAPDIYARLFGCAVQAARPSGPVRISPELRDRLRRDAERRRALFIGEAFVRAARWLRRFGRPVRHRPNPPVAPHPCG